MSGQTNKAVVRRFLEEVARGEIDRAIDLLAPDAVVHLAGAPGPLDRAAFAQFGKAFHAAFADERLTVEDQVAEGDRVVTRLTETATHVGPFMGIPPTGRMVRMTGIWIDRVVDGTIVERWSEFDQLGMLGQLGLVPAPAQPPAPAPTAPRA
jgi:steroid delta-isomerase-like uncharacterized protein